jgi:hypothetical protein
MERPATCGEGLAANASLSASLADVVDGVADNLEVHVTALDLSDENAQRERDAYRALAAEHRIAAAALREIADHMASYRRLPMARHDAVVMTGGALREAFEAFVERESALHALLDERLAQEREMLAR